MVKLFRCSIIVSFKVHNLSSECRRCVELALNLIKKITEGEGNAVLGGRLKPEPWIPMCNANIHEARETLDLMMRGGCISREVGEPIYNRLSELYKEEKPEVKASGLWSVVADLPYRLARDVEKYCREVFKREACTISGERKEVPPA